jgi:hypothetical protein
MSGKGWFGLVSETSLLLDHFSVHAYVYSPCRLDGISPVNLTDIGLEGHLDGISPTNS